MSARLSRRAFTSSVALLSFLAGTRRELRAAKENGSRAKDEKSPAAAKDGKSAAAEPVYEPGGDVKLPKLVHYVEPKVSNNSKQAFINGLVRISIVVTSEGKPTELQVTRGLTADEDRAALDAVAQWRFQPGTRNGQPVNVRVTAEVEFNLL